MRQYLLNDVPGLELGLLETDAFNATIPYRASGAINYDASVFDGRGRRLYARVLMQL